MAVLSDTNLRPVPSDKSKKKKKKKTKTKTKARSTDLRLTNCTIFHPATTPSFKIAVLWLKWQVAQSFHQARSHDLFLEGVGGPKKVDLLD